MSKIEIKINHTKSVNNQIKQLSSKLTNTKISLSMIRSHVDSKVVQRSNIGQRLDDAVARINASEKRLQDLYQCIEHSLDLYIKAEKRVQSLKPEEIEKNSIWDTAKDSVKGFGKGLVTAVVSTFEGIWHAITHPVETIKGTIHVITHPVETGKAIWKAISDSWKKDVVNGDAESRSHWFGRAFGEVALAIVGTKGVDKGVKLVRSSEILSNEVGAVRIGRASVDEIGLKSMGNVLETVPSVRNGEFRNWFNSLTTKEFDNIWADPKLRDSIKDRLRYPGGMHEWHLVSRADTFKYWGVTAEQITEIRTLISETNFVNPTGKHGGKGSTKAHNELLQIIDTSKDYDMFIRRLQNWADYRFEGGSDALPDGIKTNRR